jgi:regulator of protease activity HflC (stomatin/prohibitin superfamily)
VTVMWRVKDPQKFYTSLSHSDFFEKEKGGGEIKTKPIYQEIVQQCASFAVTRAFAIHSLDDIMINNRHEVEEHCRQILQDKLNEQNGGIDSGIEIVDLTIKDLHPPYGIGMKNDPTSPGGVRLGPAHAYENVTSMREVRETLKNYGEASRITQINLAKGAAANEISRAMGYKAEKVAKAQGEAARMIETIGGIDSLPEPERHFAADLAEREARYRVLKDILTPVQKILVDPRMKEGLNFIQNTEKGNAPAAGRPPGQ